MATFEGELTVKPGTRFGIVVARFNAFVTERLLAGCVQTLRGHGADEADVDVAWVPGAFEIPTVARRMTGSDRYAAVICLGCVIRGETPHFDHIAGAARQGVAAIGAETGRPVIFGVLTTDTVEQAIDRAGAKAGNKGADAAKAAIEMVNLLEKL